MSNTKTTITVTHRKEITVMAKRYQGDTPDADPVLRRTVAVDLLDEIDQAWSQLESGDVHGEDKHDLAMRIEHLQQRAVEAIIEEAGPQSEEGRRAELADLATWRTDDDYATDPDQPPQPGRVALPAAEHGEDPIERARRAVEHLDAARAAQTQSRQAQPGHTTQLSAAHTEEATRRLPTTDGLGPREPGW